MPRGGAGRTWWSLLVAVALLAPVVLGGPPPVPQARWTDDAAFARAARAQLPRIDRLSQEAAVYGQAPLNAAARSLRAAVEAGDRDAVARAVAAVRAQGEPVAESDLAAQARRLDDTLGAAARQTPAALLGARNLARLAGLVAVYLAVRQLGLALARRLRRRGARGAAVT